MADELAKLIAADDLVVFSYSGCPYCRILVDALNKQGVAYKEVDYDECDDGEAVRAEVLKQHKQRSVPAVFCKGKFIGGCNDGPEPWMGAKKLLESGWLKEKLAE